VVDTDAATARVDTVADLLTKSVGVQVRRFGGLGAFSTVSIRGSTPNQVDIFLDNVRLNQANAGLVDLGDLPLDNLERIEIYRGFAPLQLGAGSIGGAIKLVTRQVTSQVHNRASVSYGSFDTRKVSLYRSQSFAEHDLGYLALFNYTESDGDFDFLDDNGTRFNTRDDEVVTRTNNDFRSFNVSAKGDISLAHWTLTLSDDFFTKDQGVNGLSNLPSEARLGVDRNVITLLAKRPGFPHAMTDLSFQFAHSWQHEAFEDRNGSISGGPEDADSTSHIWSAQSLLNLYLDDWHQILGLMLEWRYETFRTIDKLPEIRGLPADRGPLQRRANLTLALQDEILLFDERLAVRPLLRYQYVSSRFGDQPNFSSTTLNVTKKHQEHLLNPSLGIKLSLTTYFDVKANAGRFQRIPTLFELFGDQGTTIGNPELDTETSVNWDVGWVLELPGYAVIDRMFLEYAYFRSQADDLIVFVQNSQASARAENIGSADISGHEVSWSMSAFGHLRLYGNYTFQDAKDASDTFSRDNQLPGRPRHELHQGIEWFAGLGKLSYELDYISQNFLDRANLRPVNNRLLHNVTLMLTPLGQHLKLTLEAKNLSDNQVGDFRGFPLPGRSFFGTVEGRF
jgi:iron complex outermembrane receptor protein